jgi:hypothetical protein
MPPKGSIARLITSHNDLAEKNGQPKLREWRGSECKLAEKVALLQSAPRRRIAPIAPTGLLPTEHRSRPSRDATIKALCAIAFYEDARTGAYVSVGEAKTRDPKTLYSVGFDYTEVARRVLEEVPDANPTGGYLRVTASMVRRGEPGFEGHVLPHKRPHGTVKRKKP